MNSVPDISVVMSVYNNADTLPASLESILSQKDVELEFIVIDDGSTDDSGKILDEAADRDPRLKVVHKQNEGLTRALIEGCAMASAPWIARQDADDFSLPGRLRAQLNRARQPDAPGLVGCGVRVCTPQNDTMQVLHPPVDPKDARRHILEDGQAISSHGSILFSREAYQKAGGYRAAFYYAQDIDLITRLAETGPVSAVDSVLYEYVFSPSAISGRCGRFQRQYYGLIRSGHLCRTLGESEKQLLAEAETLRLECLHCRGESGNMYEADYFIGTCLVKSNPAAARVYFAKAMRCCPWSGKAWARWLQSVWLRKRGTS